MIPEQNITYCGQRVKLYPANKGCIRIESPLLSQTVAPHKIIQNCLIHEGNAKYSVIINDDGTIEKGYRQ